MTDEASNGHFDIGGMFRNSATITFVVEILSIIVMVGSVLAWYIGGFLDIIAPEIQILLLLILSIITLIVFLAAFSVFLRFSRRLSNAVVGHGLEQVAG
jgi:cation transporter-like permease